MRKRPTPVDLTERSPVPDASEEPGSSQPSRLRVVLLVLSSALLSGIAVALWNRRSLERIREARPEPMERASQGSQTYYDSHNSLEFV